MYLFILKHFTVLLLKNQIINNIEPCTNLSSFYRLESYQTRKKDYDEIAVEIVGELTPFERELLKRQEVVEIRGKVCLSLF